MLKVYERAIIQYLRDEKQGSATTVEIVRDVGMIKTTAYKYLKMLEEKGYIVRCKRRERISNAVLRSGYLWKLIHS